MFRALSLSAAAGAFFLVVLGSWVRINGAGMTCPDWPLCHGALIPALGNGVAFEWSHRLVALLEALLVLPLLWIGWRERTAVAGVTPVIGFIAGCFALQIALGGLTVALSNSPWSVVIHWATAMLLLAGLATLAILAVLRPRRIALADPSKRSGGLLGILLGACVGLALLVMCAGAYVSSSGAGLACATLPACNGGSWSGSNAAQTAQMTHRLLAALLVVVATVAAYAAALGTTVRVRIACLFGYALIVLQAMLGLANVAWALPTILREAHAADAAATFLAFLAAAVFAAVDGTVPAAGRSTAPLGSNTEAVG